MPSFRFKKRLLLALVVVCSAMGHGQSLSVHLQGAASGKTIIGNDILNSRADRQAIVFKRISTYPRKQTNATEKRHKRLLIGKAWQPVAVFTFIKRYRLVTVPADYSSPHILQRTAFVFSLRGPPVTA